MQDLLKNGYRAKLRPSGHDISTNFSKDNGGAIPSNLLQLSNTESNSRYQQLCREAGLPIHPARFPAALPEFFVKFLTDENDLVIDPFAGSNVTGEVCERLQRKWIAIELVEEYLVGSKFRFNEMLLENNDEKGGMSQSQASLLQAHQQRLFEKRAPFDTEATSHS